jgi:predicted transcriptional regulator
MNKSYVLVNTKELVQKMARHILEYDIIAFDTETTSLNTRKGEIIGWSVSGKEGEGYYLPTKLFENQELVDAYIESIKAYDISVKLINMLIGKKLLMHNASFDCRFVKNYFKIDLLDSLHADTMLLVHTVNEEGAGFGSNSPFGLKSIAKMIQTELGLDIEKSANEEQLALKSSIKENGGSVTRENYEIWKADINILAEYAAADTDLTLRIYNHFIKDLYDQGLENFFFVDEVMPLYKEVTIPMESIGVKLDMDLIRKTKEEVTQALEDHRTKVMDQLLSYAEVKNWIMLKAAQAFPANNRGTFAVELINQSGIDFPKSEKSGKYNIANANILRIPDSAVKQFLLHGDAQMLDKLEPKQETLEEAADEYFKLSHSRLVNEQQKEYERELFINGYKLAQERMYSEEDMRKAIFTSFLLGVDRGNYSKELEDDFTKIYNDGSAISESTNKQSVFLASHLKRKPDTEFMSAVDALRSFKKGPLSFKHENDGPNLGGRKKMTRKRLKKRVSRKYKRNVYRNKNRYTFRKHTNR